MKFFLTLMWWTWDQARQYGIQRHSQMHLILKVNIQMKPEAFLLGMLDDCVGKNFERLFLNMTTAAHIL